MNTEASSSPMTRGEPGGCVGSSGSCPCGNTCCSTRPCSNRRWGWERGWWLPFSTLAAARKKGLLLLCAIHRMALSSWSSRRGGKNASLGVPSRQGGQIESARSRVRRLCRDHPADARGDGQVPRGSGKDVRLVGDGPQSRGAERTRRHRHGLLLSLCPVCQEVRRGADHRTLLPGPGAQLERLLRSRHSVVQQSAAARLCRVDRAARYAFSGNHRLEPDPRPGGRQLVGGSSRLSAVAGGREGHRRVHGRRLDQLQTAPSVLCRTRQAAPAGPETRACC